MCAPDGGTVAATSTSSSSSSAKILDDVTQALEHKEPLVAPRERGNEQQLDRAVLLRGTWASAASLGFLLTANSMVLPHLQSRREALGCDTAACQGALTSTRSTLMLLGATGMGRLSDMNLSSSQGSPLDARRICLLVGIAAAACTLLLSFQAASLVGLWLSLVPGALLQQNWTVLKALMADYHERMPGGSSASDRAATAGRLGMAAGLSMMLGPLLTATVLPTYPSATAGALVSLVLAAALVLSLPSVPTTPLSSSTTTQSPSNSADHSISRTPTIAAETVTLSSSLEQRHQQRPPPFRSISSFWTRWSSYSPPALFLLTTRLLSMLAFHIYQTIWNVHLREKFAFGPSDYGRFFAMIGLVYALSQGFLARFLLDRLGGGGGGGKSSSQDSNSTHRRHAQRVRLLTACCGWIGVARYCALSTSNLWLVYPLIACKVTAMGVLSTVFAADVTHIADPRHVGSFLGVMSAVESGAGMLGPVLGGALSAWVHPTAAPLVAVLLLNAVLFGMVALGYDRMVLQQQPQAASQRPKQD